MKAIVQDRYGSTDVLKLAEVDRPEIGDHEVLVRVHAAGLDPGVWHLMTGQPYMIRIMGYGLRKPKTQIPGTDLAGVVETVGKNVTRFRAGDEVFGGCARAFAEFVAAPEAKFAPKPTHLTFVQAAAITTSGLTALQALRDAGKLEAGQKALIIGAAGGVGTFAVQIAKAFGAQVTGLCSTTKTELVRSIGADHAIDYTREDFADGREHYDMILDSAGNRSLSQLRRALTPKGTLVIIGGEGGGRWLGGTDRLLRAAAWSPLVSQTLRPMIASGNEKDLSFLKGLVEAGKLTPVIDRTYPLSEVPDAIRYLAGGNARGKSVITVIPAEGSPT